MTRSSAGSPNRWLVLTIVCIAQFMVVLDATITNVALPTIQADLELSNSSLAWIVNSYTLLFGGLLLLGGRASDLFGRKRLFIIGVVVFTGASALCGLAQNGEFLIAARALQGLGAALVSPGALSIVTTTFDEGKDRAKALGAWAAIAVGGAAIGLLVGGVLTQYASWQWIFFVNVPIGILAILLAVPHVPESRGEGAQGFDLVGAVLVTAGLVVLVYGIVKAEEFGWASAKTLGLLAGAVALLAAFVVQENRAKHPLMRLGLFRTRSLTASNVSMLLVAGGMFAVFFLATLYVQRILGLSPIEAGLGFLPLTAAIILSSGIAQNLVTRIGVRPVTLSGLAVAALGLALLSQVSANGSYVADILPGIIVMGLGLGFVFVPLTLVATANIASDDAGLASGIFNTSQQVGGALGLAILATVANSTTRDKATAAGIADPTLVPPDFLVAGYGRAFWVAAGLVLAGFIFAAFFIRRSDVIALEGRTVEAPATH